jgi:hypothetical protein
MGSVLALTSFKQDFGLPTDSSGFSNARNAQISSNVVSLLTAGCFFGAIAAAICNERFGRRYSLMFFTVIFLIGAAIQTGAQHDIGMIYGGRVVAGLGIGGHVEHHACFRRRELPSGRPRPHHRLVPGIPRCWRHHRLLAQLRRRTAYRAFFETMAYSCRYPARSGRHDVNWSSFPEGITPLAHEARSPFRGY